MTGVIVDGGHLLASASRSLGLGARRRSGRFDLVALLDAVLALLPSGPLRPVWIDGAVVSGRDELLTLEGDGRVDVRRVPVRGGRQRGAEVAVLQAVHALAREEASELYLVGDPRRHEAAVHAAEASGTSVTFVGVAYGEPSPAARRIWLRRSEVEACVADRSALEVRRRSGYRPPRLLPPSG